MILGLTYVFLAVPRTASMSIAAWLVAHHGGVQHGDHHSTDVPVEHQHKFTWAVVRDPFTRVPSLYRYVSQVFWPCPKWQASAEAAAWAADGQPIHSEMETFIGWCQTQSDHKWCPQARMLAGVHLDAVLRYEALDCALAGLPFVDDSEPALPHTGRTTGQRALTAGERAAILEHSREDFERFGYEPGKQRRSPARF